jgi:hypothetical protein
MNVRHVLLVAGCALAWVALAEHPNARNLRNAIASTLPLV